MLTECPGCKRSVSAKMARCPFCNFTLRGVEAATVARSKLEEPPRCPKCSVQLPASRYCRKCNYVFEEEKRTERCPQCGRPHAADMASCPRCGFGATPASGAGPSPSASAPMPGLAAPPPAAMGTYGRTEFAPNLNYGLWIALSIGAMFCCCTPGGIVSLVYAIQAQNAGNNGDYIMAEHALGTAKTWFWISFACGFIAVPLVILASFADLLAGGGGGYGGGYPGYGY